MERTEQRAKLRKVLEAKYPDLDLTDVQLDNYLDAQERMRGQPTERRAKVGPIDVKRVTPEMIDDVLDFFDHRAFANNPGWASCYCMFHHLPPDAGWESRGWEENREDLRRRLLEDATRAFVAYDGDHVMGWLNASDRAAYPEHRSGDDEGVASLVCFLVAATHRGHGLGAMLLETALRSLAEEGIALVEAYPVSDDASDTAAYHGRARLFRGFENVGDETSPTVQRRL